MLKIFKYIFDYVNKVIDILFFYLYNYREKKGGRKMADMNIKDVDEVKKRKAIFYLNSKGSDLSTEVRKMLDKFAKEFDKKNSK